MLLDISGNTFSSLGSSVPTRLFGPREIYGNSLQVHVDTTDYRNLFTTATGTTNVPVTGQTQVRRLDDISGKGRKFYYFSGTTAQEGASLIDVERFSSTTLNQFSGSSFDTNKGVFGIDNFPSVVSLNKVMVSLLSFTAITAPDSAATVCFYGYWYGFQNYTASVIGLARQYYLLGPLLGFGSANSSYDMFFNVKGTIRSSFNAVAYAQKTSMFLGTITGNTYYWYINDILITSGTMTGAIYPISGGNNIGGYWVDSFQGTSARASLSKTHEGFISHSYTTPEQVKLLYNYFTTKFKNKRGNYT
jgi:hypothetical protein